MTISDMWYLLFNFTYKSKEEPLFFDIQLTMSLYVLEGPHSGK